jgi:hypothetical protein
MLVFYIFQVLFAITGHHVRGELFPTPEAESRRGQALFVLLRFFDVAKAYITGKSSVLDIYVAKDSLRKRLWSLTRFTFSGQAFNRMVEAQATNLAQQMLRAAAQEEETKSRRKKALDKRSQQRRG